jgi:hypothetical protein
MPYFKAGFDMWSLFFAINLKLVDYQEMDKEALAGQTKISKLSALMKKIIDCCKEW